MIASGVLGLAVVAAPAKAGTPPPTCVIAVTDIPPNDPHLQRYTVSGAMPSPVVVNVLLPPGYATSGQRYPVLYHFHGGSCR